MYPQVFGKYVLERELARGGMARVLLATLRGAGGFEKKLVVKQIRDELAFDHQFVRRFVEEAKTTVALSHPNIVPVYELGVEQGTYFLAMELVVGVSVAELLREAGDDGGPTVLSPEEGAYVGVEVCRALDYAHRRMKVVHRDITPRNVMIDEEGQIKLIDFGIAAPALVAGQEILGSPGHMPPEQTAGAELGAPTDIFALAVLLVEAWTGAAPFRRATPEESAAAMRDPHPRPSDFDARLGPLDDAIARAMSLDPRDRQEDAAELGRALRGFLGGLDPSDVARGLGERVRALRERASLPAPPSPISTRASAPSHGELGTKTFATRDDPAMSIPTPLMVEVGELERIHGTIAAAREERQATIAAAREESHGMAAAREERLETIATRPLETPVRAFETAPRPPAAGRRVVAVAAGVAALALALAAWRARTPAAPVHAATSASMEAPPAPPPTASVEPKAAPARVMAPPPVTASAAPLPAVGDAPATTPAPASKTAVTFLGDPGTRVSVDGVPRGECPVRVSLGEGGHDVRFTFEPTGEIRGQRFSVKPGEHLVVRADFTGATPTVKFVR